MVALLQSLGNVGIWFLIVWLPILLALALLTVVAIWVGRRLTLKTYLAQEHISVSSRRRGLSAEDFELARHDQFAVLA